MWRDGIIALNAPLLDDCDFVLVKIDGGRGFFGGRRSSVSCFHGTIAGGELTPSVTVRNLPTALDRVQRLLKFADAF